MKGNKATAAVAASEKRDPGFVKIRRGLEEHLHNSRMSSNATKLYLWFQLRAQWREEARGTVETDYDAIARRLGWVFKMVQRTIRELVEGGYIEIIRAANQHEVTTIRIINFDGTESGSAVDTGVHSTKPSVDAGVDRAVDTGVQSGVHSNAPITQSAKDLQAPKKSIEVIEGKKGTANAVRRPVDAELRIASRKSFSPSEKRQNLEERIAKKISQEGNSFWEYIERCLKRGRKNPFGDAEQKAFSATRYKPNLKSRLLGFDFVMTVVDVFEETQGKGILPGNLCSRIIDRCQTERELGDGTGYYWPPDFQRHRDQLRAQEQLSQPQGNASAEVRR